MSIVARRSSVSGGNLPKVIIPTHGNIKDSNQYDNVSPTLTVNTSPLSGRLSPEIQPNVNSTYAQNTHVPPSGSLSPELQPNTPPVLSGKNNVLQIGKYLLVEELDANVHKAVDIQSGKESICKVFTQETYRSKIAAYCRLYESSSVAEIKEIIQGNKYVYVFFDKNYGDLHSYVRSKRKLKEDEAMNLYRQIAEAVQECHQCGVVIRDLKLRKFVFTNPERTKLQLEGLEDSHILEDEENDTLCDKQGCPAYVSPEILERAELGYSGKASDQWSSGVMLYTMLVGRYPFQDNDTLVLFKKIKLGKYNIPPQLSPKAKCLIRNLLRRESSDRLTAEEVLLHPWLKSSVTDNLYSINTSRDTIIDQQVPKWDSNIGYC